MISDTFHSAILRTVVIFFALISGVQQTISVVKVVSNTLSTASTYVGPSGVAFVNGLPLFKTNLFYGFRYLHISTVFYYSNDPNLYGFTRDGTLRFSLFTGYSQTRGAVVKPSLDLCAGQVPVAGGAKYSFHRLALNNNVFTSSLLQTGFLSISGTQVGGNGFLDVEDTDYVIGFDGNANKVYKLDFISRTIVYGIDLDTSSVEFVVEINTILSIDAVVAARIKQKIIFVHRYDLTGIQNSPISSYTDHVMVDNLNDLHVVIAAYERPVGSSQPFILCYDRTNWLADSPIFPCIDLIPYGGGVSRVVNLGNYQLFLSIAPGLNPANFLFIDKQAFRIYLESLVPNLQVAGWELYAGTLDAEG